MKFLSSFWRWFNPGQGRGNTASSAADVDATTSMLRGLQQLCAVLPQGQAEVCLKAGLLQVSLTWSPEDCTCDAAGRGWYFGVNGQNQEVQVAELSDETVPEKTVGHPESHPDKPSRQFKALTQLLQHLQLHYAFRYNRLTDCTEAAFLSDGEGAEEAHHRVYRPVDQRVLNSISLEVMQAGISCWDRDVKRFVESADIPAYHPFEWYLAHLPAWDGKDRVISLAQRVSGQEVWVKSFHRWMLAMTAQWMGEGKQPQRANSVAPLLVSAQQGLGKSTFCRLLLPDVLQTYFTESFDLTNPVAAEGKLASFGLINLDEFDRIPASRMPQLKNLMQLERLHIRRAYKHSGEPLPRIANFIGTSNQRALLTDPSGSRRFICVEVDHPIDCTTPIEYDQLYAQLKYELEHGERSWFSKEEEAEIQAANQAFYRVTPAEELFEEAFHFAEAGEEGAHLLSAAQIYTSLKSKYPAALRDCTPLAFSRWLAQMGRRVHTRTGNGYWVKVV